MTTNRFGPFRLLRSAAARPGRVVVAPRSRPPFAVDALVLEEDTWLALSAAPLVREPAEHPIRTMTAAWEAEPAEPGSIRMRSGRPLRILAVVHDLSLDPSWRVEWIDAALRRAFAEARRRGLGAVGVEPLGAVHGRFPEPEFDALLDRTLRAEAEQPRAVWRIEPARGRG